MPTYGNVSSLTVDDAGNLYALSSASPQLSVTPRAYQSSDHDTLFILKFDPQGNPIFTASINATAADRRFGSGPLLFGPAIALDAVGNIIFTGIAGDGFPVVNDPDPQSNDCALDTPCMAYVASLDNTGSTLQYARLLGHGEGQALTFDPSGNVWVAGAAYAGYFPRTLDAFNFCSGPPPGIIGYSIASDGFVMRLDPAGDRLFSSYVLGPFLSYNINNITHLQLGSNGALNLGGQYFAAVVDNNQSPPVPHACLVNATQNIPDADTQYAYVAPGQMVTLFGEGLGPPDAASAEWNPDGTLATLLAGVHVLFNGIPAPLLSAQANKVNCIVPFGVADGNTASITVKYAGAQTDPLVFHVAKALANPFTKDYLPGSDLIAINNDGTLNSPNHPAARGSIITLFATGLGQTDPPLKDGQISSSAAPVQNSPFVDFITIPPTNRISADVLYQGSIPGQIAGLYQMNVRVPTTAATGHAYVQFTANFVITPVGIWLQ
jgi:uncharacterized protein (TIGR03437 family)